LTVDAGTLVFAMQATANAYNGNLVIYGYPGTDKVLGQFQLQPAQLHHAGGS